MANEFRIVTVGVQGDVGTMIWTKDADQARGDNYYNDVASQQRYAMRKRGFVDIYQTIDHRPSGSRYGEHGVKPRTYRS